MGFVAFFFEFEQHESSKNKYILQNKSIIDGFFKSSTEPNYLLKIQINFDQFIDDTDEDFEESDIINALNDVL